MAAGSLKCKNTALLHQMLLALNPDGEPEVQSGQKTIYRFENGNVVLSAWDSTVSCAFQGKLGENTEIGRCIIAIIEEINRSKEN